MLLPESILPLTLQFTSPGSLLIHLGPLQIRWYGLLIASAVLLGTNLAQALAKRRGIKPDLLSELVIWLVLAAIPSARLYYVLFEWQTYAHIILGTVWAVWHIIPWFQGHPNPAWVAWQSAATVAMRIPIVWLYNNTGKQQFQIQKS